MGAISRNFRWWIWIHCKETFRMRYQTSKLVLLRKLWLVNAIFQLTVRESFWLNCNRTHLPRDTMDFSKMSRNCRDYKRKRTWANYILNFELFHFLYFRQFVLLWRPPTSTILVLGLGSRKPKQISSNSVLLLQK